MQTQRKNSKMRSAAGFTLVELMISTVISGFVVAGGVTAMMAFNRMEADLGHERKAGQQNRRGTAVLERMLLQAGYGVDPFIAFDPHRPDEDCKANNGICLTNNLGAPGFPTYTAAVGSDDVLFAARDPNYFALAEDPDTSKPDSDPTKAVPMLRGKAWQISAASATSLTLEANGSATKLPPGTVLLAICPGGYTYTLVTLRAAADVLATTDTTVSLTTEVADDPFQQSNAAGSAACLGAGQARAFVINRYRFMVRQDNAIGRRYLLLSRSLDRNGDAKIDWTDWEVVSANVGDLQAAYIMRDGTVWGQDAGAAQSARRPGGANQSAVLSALTDAGLEPCSNEMTIPFYQARALAPCQLDSSAQRANATAAATQPGQPEALWGNVRAVRLTLLTQTQRPMLKRGGAVNTLVDAPLLSSTEDHLLPAARDGKPRFRLSTVVPLPNMASRGIPLI
ncbi:MAG: prepilin-type N-terminal cleavage/methylation domain-containing protein [Deltaproteobacteria bacterium]|nr:prepilin-type N-terminal cleavage/methylation domain-containing protein [Deltaproteobacteria bacterium]